jgi:hypothetical protein
LGITVCKNAIIYNVIIICYSEVLLLTWSPMPVYMHPTMLSSNVMSNFWLKSSNLEACSARVAILVLWNQHKYTLEFVCTLNHSMYASYLICMYVYYIHDLLYIYVLCLYHTIQTSAERVMRTGMQFVFNMYNIHTVCKITGIIYCMQTSWYWKLILYNVGAHCTKRRSYHT